MTLIFGEPTNVTVSAIQLSLGLVSGLLIGLVSWRSSETVYLASFPAEDDPSAYYPWGNERADDPKKFEAQFRRDWQSMPHRDVVDLANLNKLKEELIASDLGPIIAATISLVPEKYIHSIYFSDEFCPLCLESTVMSDRLASSLHAKFESIENISSCAWVHRLCFESLPLREDLPGFPI